MTIPRSFIAATLISIFLVGCATRQVVYHESTQSVVSAGQEIAPLKQEAGWPVVEAAVKSEVARNEGTNSPLTSAYYNPLAHQKGTWAVVVSTAYPDYRQADHICLLVSYGGQIGSYAHVPGRARK